MLNIKKLICRNILKIRYSFTISAIVFLLAGYAVTFASSEMSEFTRADDKTLKRSDIDTTVQRLMNAGDVTGLGLALIADGQVSLPRQRVVG